jgi:hypothetical protein
MSSDIDPSGRTAGLTIFDVVKESLAEEIARKASIEARGTGVITTSGVLVTLLFGLSAVVTKPSGYVLPIEAVLPLVVGLVIFCAAILVALATFVPRDRYLGLDPAELDSRTDKDWDEAEGPTRKGLAQDRLKILQAAVAANDEKVRLLRLAIGLQAAAFISVATSIAAIFLTPFI